MSECQSTLTPPPQQDDVPCHTAKLLMEWDLEVKTWAWFPNPPDPNQIEHVFGMCPNKSDPWRPYRGSDLALTRRGIDTGPLRVCLWCLAPGH